MKQSLIIVCLEMFVFSCSPAYKCNSNGIMEQTDKIETNDNLRASREQCKLACNCRGAAVNADFSRNLLLNETESSYLNRILETIRKDFDFTNKKVGFLTGSSGKTISNKEDYFEMQKKHSANEKYPCDNGTLYVFNVEQKAESGGYDAAIVYWSKFLLPIEDVIKRLKRKH